MSRHLPNRIPHRGILSLALATVLATGGCALFPDSPPSQQRDSDTMGEGLRAIPDDGPSAASSTRKQPFWEKYRDKRVQQIDRNLGVAEPAGW